MSRDPTVTDVTTLPEDGVIMRSRILPMVCQMINVLLQVGGMQKIEEIVSVFISGLSIVDVKIAQDD